VCIKLKYVYICILVHMTAHCVVVRTKLCIEVLASTASGWKNSAPDTASGWKNNAATNAKECAAQESTRKPVFEGRKPVIALKHCNHCAVRVEVQIMEA
jgi:hypothetical protein